MNIHSRTAQSTAMSVEIREQTSPQVIHLHLGNADIFMTVAEARELATKLLNATGQADIHQEPA